MVAETGARQDLDGIGNGMLDQGLEVARDADQFHQKENRLHRQRIKLPSMYLNIPTFSTVKMQIRFVFLAPP